MGEIYLVKLNVFKIYELFWFFDFIGYWIEEGR